MPSLKTDANQRVLYPIADIKEGDRIRKDYGDVQDLAASIKENGLIHPIVINTAGVLIAGGRRFRAMRDILKWVEAPVTYFEFADEATLRILEREENVRRKQMSWQEEVLSIAEVHKHHSLNAALNSQRWSQKATGELLGMSEASASYCLQIAELIRAKDKDVLSCARFTDAIGVLVKRRAIESNKLVAKLTLPKIEIPTDASLVNIDDIFADAPVSSGGITTLEDDGEVPGGQANSAPITVPLSKMLLKGNSVDICTALPSESIDAVITDWPYGIDMDNLQQVNIGKDVSSTAAEHEVAENRALQLAIVPAIYRLLKPNAFFVTFADISLDEDALAHMLTLIRLFHSVGFKVQRWPLVWFKTGTGQNCQNGAAGYNFTKNYEIAIVCRKGNATLACPQGSSVFPGGDLIAVKSLGHPFAKPFSLWQWLYAATTIRGQVVLDPFAGSGSSTIAALIDGRSPIAIEKNEAHFNSLVVNVSEWYKKNLPNVKFE